MTEEKTWQNKLTENRIIIICGKLMAPQVASIVSSLLELSAQNDKEDIKLYIGSTEAFYLDMLAIYDTMRSIPNDISGTCIDGANDSGALLLAACTKGKRYALPHATISFEQPYGILSPGPNQQTEIAIEAKEVTNTRKVFEELMAEVTGQDVAKIHTDCEFGVELSAEEAKAYGIIDRILVKGE